MGNVNYFSVPMKKFRSRSKNGRAFPLTPYLILVTKLLLGGIVPLKNLHPERLSFPNDLDRVGAPRHGKNNDRDFSKVISKSKRKGIPYLKEAS
jgi:hypothetical protein